MLKLGALLLATAALGGAAAAGGSAAESARAPAAVRLQPFAGCGQLLEHVKRQALRQVGPWGLTGPIARDAIARVGAPIAAPGAAAAPGVDYSTTNVQEEGVDEPDLVKTNGAFLFVAAQGAIRAVDVRGARPRLAGSLALDPAASHELLLNGDRLLVLSRGGPVVQPLPGGGGEGSGVARLIGPSASSGSTLAEIDVSEPQRMRVVRTLELQADYLSARLTGSTARVVTVASMPRALRFVQPATSTPGAEALATRQNRAVVARSGLRGWLPAAVLRDRRGRELSTRPLVQCRQVRKPSSYSGLGLLTVLTLDLRSGIEPVDSDAVLADGRIVYGSAESLYVATERWADRLPAGGGEAPEGVFTAIHRFDVSEPGRTDYRASGRVSGYLLDQWSLSEHEGFLRVASTEMPTWWAPSPAQESESFVTVLRERAGALAQVGRVGGLGKGERVYAVRFGGAEGYVVTFRQVDPLYTLDLSRPERPAVLGELKILGYSAYLHPLGDGLLLGVGQDAGEDGRVRGTQLSLFDVSDPRRPARLHAHALGAGWSEAENDHHAFLYWAPRGLVVVPVQADAFAGAIGFRVARAGGIEELGRVAHEPGGVRAGSPLAGSPVRRSLVVGDALYTVSELGVRATGLARFEDRGWAGFPAAPRG